jgi:alanyl-tRNA synthetase
MSPTVEASQIRRAFLDYYRERGHHIAPSASLVPDDPNLLLTVAGMVPFKPYFLGEKPIEHPRIASCQKCVRTNDIENVGRTARHLTLFEMLGNFSFGDYYKSDAIRWAWELSTKVLGFDPDRLWATIFEDDDEAFEIWRDEVGLPEDRIIRRGADDNFWWMGVAGPGGPCSELFYDRRPEAERGSFDDGDGLMEFYNLVFTENEVDDSGKIVGALAKKNVDTGMGLDRVAVLLQGVDSIYECDHFKPLIATASKLTGKKYGSEEKTDVSLRIIAEHSRAAAFMIGDGIMPGNEGRGYILRRLLRRAVRHAKMLGIDDLIMPTMVGVVIDQMSEAYPDLASSREFITQVARGEEEGFRATLRQGLSLLEKDLAAAKEQRLSGETAFMLHDTYGFPLELTTEIAQEAGLEVDVETFGRLMEEQRQRARSAREVGSERGDTGRREVLAEIGTVNFTGYDRTKDEAKLVGVLVKGARVDSAKQGSEVEIILDSTPFYPEGGGQVGDRGVIETPDGRIEITDTQRVLDDLIVHTGKVLEGEIASGTPAAALVDEGFRQATERSHTATHILHATLRAALGEHARQAGSLVEPGRLRFDFAHFEKVPHEILDGVEELVNSRLVSDEPVLPYETTLEEARNLGAMMLFEEKYGDMVRVVEIGDYSIELCGGIHVTRTSQVGVVKLLGEASIGSNLRRVEALTGRDAIEAYRQNEAILRHIAGLLKTDPAGAPARVEKLLADLKAAEQAAKKAAAASAGERAKELATGAEDIGRAKAVLAEIDGGLAPGDLQELAVQIRDRVGEAAAVVVASGTEGRASIVCAVGSALAVDASTLIKDAARAIGGGAGGRGPVATGGGKDPSGIPDALKKARAAIAAELA